MSLNILEPFSGSKHNNCRKELRMDQDDFPMAGRFQAGDLEALRLVAERHQSALFHLGLHLLGNPDDAADLVQDTLLRAFEKRRQYDPQRPLKPWLFKIGLNLGRERLRRRREVSWEETDLPEAKSEADQERCVLQSEQEKTIGRALRCLTAKHREILGLRFKSDLSLKEIAQVLGISLGTVKSRLSRALLQFQRAYSIQGGEAL